MPRKVANLLANVTTTGKNTLHHPPSLPPGHTPYPHLSHTHTHIHSCFKIIIIIINGSSYTNSGHTLHNPIRLHWKVYVILSKISFHTGYVEHHTEGASTKWHLIHCTLDPFHTDTQTDSLIMQLWSNPGVATVTCRPHASNKVST